MTSIPLVSYLYSSRISRAQFWVACLFVWAILAILKGVGYDSQTFGWLATLCVTAALVLVCRNRLHDLNRSGWWLLSVLIPILGGLWLVWQLGFKRGDLHSNRWGQGNVRTHDFLKVA
jgi:uncharacterized membrane protein YhaH (DUF805 family)